MNLEELFDEIQSRKISFDRAELSEWLFEYACHFKENYQPNLTIEEIMQAKVFYILFFANVLYWKINKPFQLILEEKSRIPECCKADYELGLIR